jgi:hypothetical protein
VDRKLEPRLGKAKDYKVGICNFSHLISLTPSPLVSLPSKESERSCTYVLVVSILPLSTIFMFDFGIDPTVWYFCFAFDDLMSVVFRGFCC